MQKYRQTRADSPIHNSTPLMWIFVFHAYIALASANKKGAIYIYMWEFLFGYIPISSLEMSLKL